MLQPHREKGTETSRKALTLFGRVGEAEADREGRRRKRTGGLESNGVREAGQWGSQRGQHAPVLAGEAHRVPAVHGIRAAETPPVTSLLPRPWTAQSDFI